MKNIIITTTIFLLTTSLSFTQNTKDWEEALTNLEQSEFVENYLIFKDKIELRMSEFHLGKDAYSQEDNQEVEEAYNKSKKKFDKIMDKMKFYFLDEDTRKMMSKNPDLFLKGLEYDMESSFRYYVNNCKKKADALSENDKGQFGIEDIKKLVNLAGEFYGMYKNVVGKIDNMSDVYFEENFSSKMRLKDWSQY